jgi:hypothetical protein
VSLWTLADILLWVAIAAPYGLLAAAVTVGWLLARLAWRKTRRSGHKALKYALSEPDPPLHPHLKAADDMAHMWVLAQRIDDDAAQQHDLDHRTEENQ